MGDPLTDAAGRRRFGHPRPGRDSGVTTASVPTAVLPYEKRLDHDPRWAFSEGSRHFEEKSAVFDALRKIAQRLNDLGIAYAVVGGMALFRLGLRRFTEDVNIIVTSESLKTIHQKLDGLGYLPPSPRSKNLRDTELGVRIEFLTTGGYPGDGKVKPVAFPEPSRVSFEADGVRYVRLEPLIELKLASGMTDAGRLKDLADVLELIKTLDLPAEFALKLDPFVRQKYQQLWKQSRRRYITIWRNTWLASQAKTLEDMIAALGDAAEELEAMRKDGVFLEDNGGSGDGYAQLVTTDPEVAKKYGLIDESEYWDGGPDGASDDLGPEVEETE